MKSKRGQIFNQVEIKTPNANYFDLSHDVKMSLNMGYLVPTCAIDVLPGDTFKIGFENLLRFAPLIAPVMHRIKVTTHYFFVPNRIVWSDWGDWITGNLDVEPPYVYPGYINQGTPLRTFEKGSVADYMGLPLYSKDVLSSNDLVDVPKINALPFSAYAKIISEYYMDQNNASDELRERWKQYSELTEGDNSENGATSGIRGLAQAMAVMHPFPKAWQHDYFTSALPWAQKGEQVFMPIGDFNDVLVKFDQSLQPPVSNTGGKIRYTNGNLSNLNANVQSTASGQFWVSGNPMYYDPNGSLVAETSNLDVGSASINNLRSAFRLQEWLEKNARGGTRYTEIILSHFGVRSSDARLQRPEYLGGAIQNMVISEVLSTAQTINAEGEIVNPVGQMAGHALSVGGSKVLNYRAEEHGWIIGIMSVMPDTAYYQGLHRKFTKSDRLNYYWPSFAHIGEQEIANKEIYIDGLQTEEDQNLTFGYIPRYTEYRFENNRVAGEFRTSLNIWHLARTFADQPNLNEDFIYPLPTDSFIGDVFESPFDRIFAVDSAQADTIYAHILNKIIARRLVPVFGTPSF